MDRSASNARDSSVSRRSLGVDVAAQIARPAALQRAQHEAQHPPGAEARRRRPHQRHFHRADRAVDAEFGRDLQPRRAAEHEAADDADGKARGGLAPALGQDVDQRHRRPRNRADALGRPQPGGCGHVRHGNCPECE